MSGYSPNISFVSFYCGYCKQNIRFPHTTHENDGAYFDRHMETCKKVFKK